MALISSVPLQTFLPLYIGSVCWTIFYDTIYAHQDKKDDVTVKVRSTALLFGDETKPILAGFGATFLGLLTYSGFSIGATLPFYVVSVGCTALHMTWQLASAQLDSRESCWQRFKSNRDLGALVWTGMAIDYILRVLLL